MTARTATLWTCRRCGTQVEVEGVGQPEGWVRAGFASPPKGEYQAINDLCGSCGGYLVSFVYGTDQEDIARDQQTARLMAVLDAESIWRGDDL